MFFFFRLSFSIYFKLLGILVLYYWLNQVQNILHGKGMTHSFPEA